MRIGRENQVNREILFVRHGKTLANEEGRYIGTTDVPLSASGRMELEEGKASYGEMLSENVLLVCGPMKRCVETAELLFPGKNPVYIPEWTEIDFGLFEGKNYEELKDNPEYLEWLASNGTSTFPRGESREAFIQRCMAGYARLEAYLAQNPATTRVVAVVHGGTIMALCSSLLGGDYFDYQVSCGGTYSCIIS